MCLRKRQDVTEIKRFAVAPLIATFVHPQGLLAVPHRAAP
jgi:hypothetical protein